MRKILAGLFAFLLSIGSATALVSPNIDTVNTTGFAHTATAASSIAVTSVSTAQANDLLFVVSYVEATGSPSPGISSISGGGLTYTARKISQLTNPSACGPTGGNTCYDDFEIWTAPISGTLGSSTITVNYNKSFDAGVVGIFGVHGIGNLASPWDTNVALPVLNTHTTNSTVALQVTGYQTTIVNDLGLVFITEAGPAISAACTSGSTCICFAGPSADDTTLMFGGTSATNYAVLYVGSHQLSSAVSSSTNKLVGLSGNCGAPASNTALPFQFLSDAVAGVAGSTGGATFMLNVGD